MDEKKQAERMKVIGNRIKKRREATGWSQKLVAEHLGIAEKSYGDYEQGKSVPNILRLIEIAEFFHCRIEDLLTNISTKPDDQAKHITELLQGVKRADRLHIVKIVERICQISKGKAKIED